MRGTRRRSRIVAVLAGLVVLAAVATLPLPPAAAATTFVVTTTVDAVDANVGNGVCATSAGACSLRAAVQEANASTAADLIQVPAGTYTLLLPPSGDNGDDSGDLDLIRPVTLVGTGAVVVDAGTPPAGAPPEQRGLDRLLEIHPPAGAVTVSGLSFRDGYAAELGGAVHNLSTGLVRLQNVQVLDSHATTFGGGIANEGTGGLELTGVVVKGNSTGGEGGGVYTSFGSLTVAGTAAAPSSIEDNEARSGGGLFNAGELSPDGLPSAVRISGTTLSGNAALAAGGGVFNDHEGTLALIDSTLAGNTAVEYGGGVASISKTTVTMTRGVVEGNTAGGDGGGVYTGTEDPVTVDGVRFTGNRAGDAVSGDGGGAGLHAGGSGAVTITGSTFTGNNSVGAGGGFATTNNGSVTVRDTTVRDNSSVAGGGGIANAGMRTTFERLTVTGNAAGHDGGGIENEGSGAFTLVESSVNGNTATNGGGLANAADGELRVVRSTFWNNRARLSGEDDSGLGGGVYGLGDAEATYENTTISGNYAQVRGGGLYIDSDSSVHVVSSTISQNSAPVASGVGGEVTSLNFPVLPSTSVLFRNTVVAGNRLGAGCNFAVGSEGGNLDSADSCYFRGPRDRSNAADPRIDAVADNGGRVLTQALRPDSYAVDGGVSPCTPTDARGVTRPKNHACDIGAFEHEGPFGPPDTTPPDTSLVDPPAAVGETAVFRFAGTDDLTPPADLLYECRILNNDPTDPPDPPDPTEPPAPEELFAGCPNPYEVHAVEEGDNRIEVRAVDRAGRVDPTPAVHHFTAGQDVTPPQTSFTLTPPNPSAGRTATFGFTATDDLTPLQLIEFECRIDTVDPEAWLECFSPTTYSNLTPGTHTVEVRATDEMDNVDPTPARYTWTVASPADCDEANVTLPAVADSWVDEQLPAENFGAGTDLTVRSDSPGADARALVRFALPTALPAACELESATLRLHAEGGEPGRVLSVVPIDAAWAENTVSWNTQPAATGAAATAASGSGYREWNLTGQVQAMLGGADNHGFLVRDPAEEADPAAEQSFTSRQADQDPGVPPTVPQLVLRFDGPGTPPPPPPAEPEDATVSCGQILTESTRLLNDLTDCPLDGLVIGAPNIEVDLNGHTIDGPGYFPDQPGSPIELPEEGLPAGVRNVGYAGVVITNGTVRDFGYGVQLMAGSRYNTVSGMTLDHNATAGVELSDADDGRNGNRVTGNTLTANEIGISLVNDSENSVVSDNDLIGNFASGIHLWSGRGHQVLRNEISGVTSDPLLDSDGGILVDGSTDNTLIGNTIADTGDAGVVVTNGAHRNRVEDNSFTKTGDAGVSVQDSDGSRIIGNTAHLASDSGIGLSGAHGGTITGNDVRFNPSGIELEDSSDNLIDDNDASRSAGTGIAVSGEALRNRILGNTVLAAQGDGIAVLAAALDADGFPADGSIIRDNTINSSLGDGISAAAGHTIGANKSHNNGAWGILADQPTIDAGGNEANGNAEAEQCSGVVCVPGTPVPPIGPDLTAPNTSITAHPADPSSSAATAMFRFTGTDDVAPPLALRFECRLDAPPDPPPTDPTDPPEGENWVECASPHSYGFLTDGEHRFEVRAVDPAGNFDLTPAVFSWTVVPAPPGPDSLPPSTTIFEAPPAVSTSTSATFGFRGSDNLTPGPNLTYQCRLDSAAFAACTSPKTYAGLSLGSHTFQVRAIDLAGNVDPTPASRTWTVQAPPPDVTPPDTLIGSGPDAGTVATTATFAFTGTEDGSTFGCSLDGAAYAPCTSPRTLTGLAVGDHTFRVRATDAAGNTDPTPAAYSWTVQPAPVPATVTCGQLLTRSTLVQNDLTDCPGDGLVIGAAGITIDLDGAVIDGIGQGNGIRNPGFDSVTVTNGTVQEFDHGVQLTAGTALGIVSGLSLRLNQVAGVQLTDADDGTNGNIVRENSIAGNATGISLENGTQGAAVRRNTIGGSSAHGIQLLGSTGNTLEANTVSGSSENGLLLDASGNNTVISNSVTASAKSAIMIQAASHGNRLEGNTLRDGEAGIEVADSNLSDLVANIANQMDRPGVVIERSHQTVVRGNDLRFNGGGIELLESNNNRLESNNASENSDTGIAIGALSLGNTVVANEAGANDSDGIAVEAEVLPDSTLPGNLLDRNSASDNSGDGITVNKAGHTVTANVANGNDGWGIYAEINNTDGGGNRAVGNTELLQCYNIECNGGPPVPPELAPPDTEILEHPANPSGSRSASFIFTGTDDNTPLAELAFECRIDNGAFADCENPRLYSNLSPGDHVFQVRAVDLAEKVDPTPATYEWTIELPPPGVPPDTTITSGPPAQTPLEEAVLQFTSNEPDVTFQCSLDDEPFAACTSPQVYEEVLFGSHEFRVRAIDPEGNVDASPAVRHWTRTGPPVVAITSGPAEPTTSSSATFTFAANEPVTRFDCSLDLAAFTECTSPVTYQGLADGDHTLRVLATDLDGASSGDEEMGVYEWTIEPSLDVTPPATVLSSGPASPSGAATFVFTGSDNVTSPQGLTFECRLDSDLEADFAECTSPYTYPNPDFPEPLTLGEHRFDVRAIDAEDNIDPTPVRHTWTYTGDAVAPQTTIANGPPATTGAPDVAFTFTADDPFATFECSLDGAAYETCDSPHQVQGALPGAHELRVRATDLSGNVEADPAVRTWTVVAAPETTITSGPAAITTSTTATFVFGSDQSGTTYACSLNGAAFTTCTSPASYTVAGGVHEFAVRARNTLGMTDQSPAEHQWTVDAPPPSPPETTITGQPAATTSATTATFTFSASEAGSTFRCSVDEAPFAACTSPVNLTGLAVGEHDFEVQATDPGGEVDATPASYEWAVTAPLPVDTTIGAAPDAGTTSTTATFTFTASEPGSTFRCSLDGAAATVCPSPAQLSGLSVGSHTFRVHAVDAEGVPDPTPAAHHWTVTAPAPVCTPGTATVGAVADSWLLQSSAAQNYGTDSVLKVDTKSGANARSMVRFTLPAVPAGCEITDAKLRLYASSYKAGRTLQALRLNGPWTETNVTWNNQPASTGSAATVASPTANRYVEWSVVSQLQSMYAGSNHGFLIRDAAENGSGLDQGFHSREKGTDNPPRLVISWG